MLKLSDLHIGYGSKPVIKGLDHHFEPGQIHGILGRNGAGKTTLFNTIFGFKKAATGKILYQDKLIDQSIISFLETTMYFYPMMTGREYLKLIHPKDQQIDQWNRAFNLPLDEYVMHYSTGMKKKIAFIGIGIQDRPVWILDEPFNGVDIESNEKLIHLIRKSINDKRIILVSSHILSTLTRICDQIHVLDQGQITHSYLPSTYSELENSFQKTFQKEIDDIFDH